MKYRDGLSLHYVQRCHNVHVAITSHKTQPIILYTPSPTASCGMIWLGNVLSVLLAMNIFVMSQVIGNVINPLPINIDIYAFRVIWGLEIINCLVKSLNVNHVNLFVQLCIVPLHDKLSEAGYHKIGECFFASLMNVTHGTTISKFYVFLAEQ